MASTRAVVRGDAVLRRREARQRPSGGKRPPVERRRLEEALDAALSVVEAAVALLDIMDGDADLEPACEDEGAQCEDEGAGDDREPDRDGDGIPERSWQIGGREVHLIDGADRSWAERYGHDDHTSTSRLHDGGGSRDCHDGNTLDPDDAPDPLQPPRYGYECVR